MADKNMRTVAAGIAATLADLFLTRQGVGTEDVSITGTQLMTFSRANLFGVTGQGLSIKEGTNARMGTATLVAGTVTVANTSVTANTRIFCFIDSGTQTNAGFLRVSARVAATSFTITSSNAGDTSGVSWLLIEPAP